ncbi:hypothetical protein [Nocardiopsis synnemataformans]|uniref:hypothetical protein n=1 Tax=Nocardiopsis synnemataformans TaxID=61305 RepID=UPI003EC0C792
MTATLTAAPTTCAASVELPAPFVLTHHVPALTVDYTGTANCRDCGADLGAMKTLAGGWVDLAAIDKEAYKLLDAHLASDEATRDCLADCE